MFEKGDWIEINDRIFEVLKVLEEGRGYSVREVLYKEMTPKLHYGQRLIVCLSDFVRLEDGKLAWERYLEPFMV